MPMILDPNWQRGYLVPYGRDKRTGQGGLAVPGVVQDFLSAIMTPGEVYQNPLLMIDPDTGRTSDYAIRRSADLAGSFSFGGPAVTGAARMAAGKRAIDPNVVNIFAGPTAKTADKGALQMAQDMAAKGIAREDIWNKTGWFKGVDGNWRFEIDDSQFKFRENPIKPMETYGVFADAKKAIDHPQLFDAYDLPYEIDAKIGATPSGKAQFPTYWNVDVPSRGVKAGDLDEKGRITARGGDKAEAGKIALHELQHAIQQKEGFARGSNVSTEAAHMAAQRDKELMSVAEANLTPSERADLQRFRQLKADYDGADVVPGDVVIEVNDLKKRLRRFSDSLDELRALRSKGAGGALEGGAISREAAFDQYLRVAGEAEARNVEARMNMTAQERKATPPWATYDIPENRQIVRFR